MQDNLEKAFGALGMSNNLTTAGGYQDQTGGFYTGGSVFARSKVNNAELFSLQMPHYRAGCGGIDLFTGGFSYINAAAFTQLLRNIGSNAGGYAFNLALATVTPQIKSVILQPFSGQKEEINFSQHKIPFQTEQETGTPTWNVSLFDCKNHKHIEKYSF